MGIWIVEKNINSTHNIYGRFTNSWNLLNGLTKTEMLKIALILFPFSVHSETDCNLVREQIYGLERCPNTLFCSTG